MSIITSPPRIPPELGRDGDIPMDGKENPQEEELTEVQLRELYDNEEIERFIEMFSTFVTEVRAPESPIPEESMSFSHAFPSRATYGNTELAEEEWASIGAIAHDQASTPRVGRDTKAQEYKSLLEEIAMEYLVPLLPPPCPPSAPFTIGRLRVTIERLYLAVLPVYGPFLSNLYSLSTWEDVSTSLIYCSSYWALWWYNLLLPALVLRVLFSLLRRRLFLYPSLDDLRRHRAEIIEADRFGEQISTRLSASSNGMEEVWRLFRVLDQARRNTFHATNTERERQKTSHPPPDADNDMNVGVEEDTTVLENANDDQETQGVKRFGLCALGGVADVHERVRNVFIWRRPKRSASYGLALTLLFFATLLPAKYLSKMMYFLLGFLYWHVIPLIASLPPSERRRLPPPFSDVPTDAEYAMELISQRVAAGLEIKPRKQQLKRRKYQQAPETVDPSTGNVASIHEPTSARGTSIDWKKWGDRVAFGKSIASDGKRLLTGESVPIHDLWPPTHPIPNAPGIAQPQCPTETHTYPCQHSSAPGIITLTQKVFFFTPLMSQHAKITIPMKAIKGVKKAGLLRGLNVRWNSGSAEGHDPREEKFLWVGERDELFARLVGSDGKRWIMV